MIVIIQGGKSSEAEVSRSTSKAMQEALQELHYEFDVLEADEALLSKLTSKNYECALIALHGTHGEDGVIQGICEFIGLPYTGSGVLASALCFDKQKTKSFLKGIGIPVAEGFLIERHKGYEVDDYPVPQSFPVVIKPNKDGSSVGISFAEDLNTYKEQLAASLKSFDSLVVEQKINGDDVTVSVLNGEALEPILIRPKEGFYDYKNKYTAGKTDYIIPAPLKAETISKLKEYSARIYKELDLKSYGRVDFMVDKEENLFALEVNTLPGMTPTSLLPKAAKQQGYSFADIIQLLIQNASKE